MSHFFSLYIELHLVMTLAAVLSWFYERVIFGAQARLHGNYALLLLSAAALSLHIALPRPTFLAPVIRIWSAPSLAHFERLPLQTVSTVQANVLSPPAGNADYFFFFVFGLVLGIVLLALIVGTREGLHLWRLSRRSYRLRQIGRVCVSVSGETQMPFSYQSFTRAHVVMPLSLMANGVGFGLALKHELHHHRQNDTLWVYGLFVLRCLCFWNPFVQRWIGRIFELQEFACDEAMIESRRADPEEYASCLIEVAQTALVGSVQPNCAVGLLFSRPRKLLSRRIESMFTEKQNLKPRPHVGILAFTIALLSLSGTAFATKGWIQDRRIGLAQAQELERVARVSSSSQFPIVVNDEVVRELNRYLGTPEGRDYMRSSLRRMTNYQAMVQRRIQAYGFPQELMAVPIVESGYRNIEAGRHGSGLWMFIKSTAVRFGLRVDDQIDQRMDEAIETDAAMRLLGSGFFRFQDWQLSLLAYNAGEGRVQEGIEKTGSRDPWALVRAGYGGDAGYLAKIMAAILIMKSPSSLN